MLICYSKVIVENVLDVDQGYSRNKHLAYKQVVQSC